ncbi:hypothetical protein MHYP_G00226290 [Metynnis hypsauchen]
MHLVFLHSSRSAVLLNIIRQICHQDGKKASTHHRKTHGEETKTRKRTFECRSAQVTYLGAGGPSCSPLCGFGGVEALRVGARERASERGSKRKNRPARSEHHQHAPLRHSRKWRVAKTIKPNGKKLPLD